MNKRWSVSGRVEPLGDYIPFGPERDKIPERFTATVRYSDSPVTLTVRASFDGDRVKVDALTVAGEDGYGVTPRDVAGLELAAVVRDISAMAVVPGDGAHVGYRPGMKPTPDELRLVAAVYWFHHVSWGEPRRAVMGHWDISRATANRWLRRCRELYDMPGDE